MEKNWFDSFELSGGPTKIKTIRNNNVAYILCNQANEDSRLLIIDLKAANLQKTEFDARDPFSRILSLALNQFDRSVAISPKWAPYHVGSRISIYALTAAKGSRQRVYGESRPRGNPDLFIYALTEVPGDFAAVHCNLGVYDTAKNGLVDALLTYMSTKEEVSEKGTILLDDLPEGFTTGLTLEEWYRSRLTAAQRKFVDKPYTSPVRLKGSAATGKTLALIVKFLHDARRFKTTGAEYRLAFITHSGATAELARAIAATLAPDVLFAPSNVVVRIATLYELASETLAVEYRDLSPIDLDAREGRQLQFELVRSIIEKEHPSLAAIYEVESSEEFMDRFLSEDAKTKRMLISEVLNEFASVLESEGIRMGNPKADAYVNNKREEWMMPLPQKGERKILLELHRKYRDLLREMGVISVDQLVADFVRYLDSNQWDNLRTRDGFDALFIDELHLFNKIERLVFPELIRDKGPFAPSKPIFMAYDFRQSEREYYGFGQSNDLRRSGSWIGKSFEASEVVELSEVFRYTPGIARFVHDLSEPFATLDIFDDIQLGHSDDVSAATEGRPELKEFSTNLLLYNTMFAEARRYAKELGSGRRVAVLCLDDSLFETYANAGQFKDSLVVIRSRDSLGDIRFAGKRFIFSVPEYVAGLQFDTVLLLNVDEKTRISVEDSPLLKRQYLSRIYLAATRAANKLILCASLEGGGPSKILDRCLAQGSLVRGGVTVG